MQSASFPESRIGPLILPEVTEILISLWKVPPQQRKMEAQRILGTERDNLATKYQAALKDSRRATIRSVFEGKALDQNYPSPFGQQWERLQKPLTSPQDWGSCKPYEPGNVTADVLAFYLSGQFTNDTPRPGYGVVFCASNLGRFVEEAQVDGALTISAVAVHEWFHGFVEATLYPRGEVPVAGFRALEEAAANRVALDWLTTCAEADSSSIEKLEQALFVSSKIAGSPGYGEFDKVDARVPGSVPDLVSSTAPTETKPDGYFSEAAYRPWTSSRAYHDQILWNGFLAGLQGETIPCYIELGGYS